MLHQLKIPNVLAAVTHRSSSQPGQLWVVHIHHRQQLKSGMIIEK